MNNNNKSRTLGVIKCISESSKRLSKMEDVSEEVITNAMLANISLVLNDIALSLADIADRLNEEGKNR